MTRLVPMKPSHALVGGLLIAFGVGGAYLGIKSLKSDPFVIKGELTRDFVQDLGDFGPVYRIEVENSQGKFSYPILASPGEVIDLERRFVSREESGTNGDFIGINPKTNVFSLDEIILLPKNLKRIKSGHETQTKKQAEDEVASSQPLNENQFTVRGELLEDYLRDDNNNEEVYRIHIRTNSAIETYNIKGSAEQLRSLKEKFVSLQDPGVPRGDEVVINPNGDEFLSPSDIRLVESYRPHVESSEVQKFSDVQLSDGTKIPKYYIKQIGKFEKGKIVIIETGYGSDYDLWIYDEGDGRPYHFNGKSGSTRAYKGGKLVEDTTENVRDFNLTYKFCDKHDPYPIWEPTAFRSDPCYLQTATELWKEANKAKKDKSKHNE